MFIIETFQVLDTECNNKKWQLDVKKTFDQITDYLPPPGSPCKISPGGIQVIFRTVRKQPRTTWGKRSSYKT